MPAGQMKKTLPPPAEAFGPLPVIWRDDDFVLVYKPAGLLVHRSAIDRDATQFAVQLVRDQLGKTVHPVHRLDKPTAGLLMFALRPAAARRMTGLFTEGGVDKRYLAVARGHCEDQLHIESDLDDVTDPTTDALARGDKPARRAITEGRTLARTEIEEQVGRYATARYSLLELRPLTGRRHQLRRHLKRINHPLVGDTSYGDGRHNRFFRDHFDSARLLLCATELSFTHPFSGATIAVTVAPDDEFLDLLAALGWGGESVRLAASTHVQMTRSAGSPEAAAATE
jgi:tRNA pseudouridine65 synthase